jgi:hypothetical protein
MVKVQITHEFVVIYPDGARLATEELHARGEQLMEALLDLETCNPDISSSSTASDGTQGVVMAELMVTAATESEAFDKSMVIVRTAIHAVGGAIRGEPERPDAEYQQRSSQLEYI